MLKLNASYSKKIPAEENFSSQSYHVSLELELPDGLTEKELRSKISETFEIARRSVESELHPAKSSETQSQPQEPLASDKQVAFLNTLVKKNGISIEKLIFRYNVDSLSALTKKQCTELIQELKSA